MKGLSIKWIAFGVLLLFVGLFMSVRFATETNKNLKTYNNSEYKFSFNYPVENIIESKVTNKSDLHLTIIDVKNKSQFKVHVYKEYYPDTHSNTIKSVNINGNIFSVSLYPAGSGGGEFVTLVPILNYKIYKDGIKYVFEFKNQFFINKTQRQLMSTLQF